MSYYSDKYIRKTSIIILSIGMMLLFNSIYAQDCSGKFEASAGPDIDVCQTGQVNLYSTIGGEVSRVEWQGGSGTFTPDRKTLEIHYVPSADEVGKDVVLTLVADNPRINCPPAKSSITVKVNSQPEADAGPEQQHLCANETLPLHGQVTGKAKTVLWTTNGSGTFDDPQKADAVYTPSQKDIAGGACLLEFTAYPFGVCDSSSDALILMIKPAAEIIIEPEVYSSGTRKVIISAKVTGAPSLTEWKTSGTGKFENLRNVETFYLPSTDDVKKQAVILYLMATKGTCITTKNINLHIATEAGQQKN